MLHCATARGDLWWALFKFGAVLEFEGLFEHDLEFGPEQFWRIDTDLDAATDGYVNQTGVLNDPNGRPVALTRQLFVVFG